MPLNLKKALLKIGNTHADFEDGDAVNFVYRRGRFTGKYAEECAGKDVAEVLPDLIIEWDIIGENGTPIACDKETCADIPIEILNGIWRAMQEDMLPNSKKTEEESIGSF